MSKLVIRMLLGASLLVSATTAAVADEAKPSAPAKVAAVSDADLAIAAHLQHVNDSEIHMGKLALKQTKDAKVKAYAKALVADHAKSNKDLAAFAKAKKVKIAKAPPEDEASKAEAKEHADLIAKLKTLKGADFDREFLAAMVAGHTKVVAKVDAQIGVVADADLKTLLTDTRPVIQKHADDAKALQPPATAAPAPGTPGTTPGTKPTVPTPSPAPIAPTPKPGT
jgi:putative membrane protein